MIPPLPDTDVATPPVGSLFGVVRNVLEYTRLVYQAKPSLVRLVSVIASNLKYMTSSSQPKKSILPAAE